MAAETKNGDLPAYPVPHSIDGNWVKEPRTEFMGLTKREVFAMAAMQGLIAEGLGPDDYPQGIAMCAFLMADAMLAEAEA